MRRATGYDNRGSNDFRPSRKDYKETTATSQTAVVLATAALHYACSDITETVESHLVPRKSLTEKLHLQLFPSTLETEPIDLVKRDPVTGYVVSTVKRNRQTWKSDRSLLIQGTPVDETRFKRVTSKSKRIKTEVESPVCIETPIDSILPSL